MHCTLALRWHSLEKRNKMIKNRTSEKLNSDLKMLKIIIGMLITGVILIVGVFIYGLLIKDINGDFLYLSLFTSSTSLIILTSYIHVEKIKKELKLRVLNE